MATKVYLGYPPARQRQWIENDVKTFVTYTEESGLPDWSGIIHDLGELDENNNIKTIRIGSTFISINDFFAYNSNITSITIPTSVTSIASYAFEGCYCLTSITIPTSVTNIGSSAFKTNVQTGVSFPLQSKSKIREWFNNDLFGSDWGPVTVHCSDGDILATFDDNEWTVVDL